VTAPRHANRGPDGKFVRADAKPVLHRQVQNKAREIWANGECMKSNGAPSTNAPIAPGIWCKFSDGEWRRVDVGQPDPATAEWLQLTAPKDPHGPRIELSSLWPWLFLVGMLALCVAALVTLTGAL
jgi:hypothetical protein